MATIDEVFETMSAYDTSFEYLTINPDTRAIEIPKNELLFGVAGDNNSERKYFMCPRYVGDNLDVSKCYVQINFNNGHDDPDGYLVTDLALTDGVVTFSWLIDDKVVAYKGEVEFSVNISDGERDWNTTTATGTSLISLAADVSNVTSKTTNVVAQLREMVDAQTAAVEAEGATQITNVQNAASEATTEAQTQIEAKGAATLETIPEDYTTIANKTNEFANALKGFVSGTAVRVDDVSPVEHHPKVTVRSKNQFDMSAFTTFTGVTYPYISEVGENYIIITSPPGYTSNGVSYPTIKLRDLCPYAEVGKTYTFSFETDSIANQRMYLSGPACSIVSGMSYTLTQAMLDSAIHPYGFNAGAGETGVNCRISNIQLEEGTVQTEFVPYVAPESVKLIRWGKNLATEIGVKYEGSGIEWIVNDDGTVIANGTAETESVCTFLPAGWETCLVGKRVTLSGCPEGGSRDTYWVMQRNYGQFDFGEGVTFTVNNSNYGAWGIVIKAGVTVNNVVFKPQLELGDTATEFEPYIVPQNCIPDTDGTVAGLTSFAPTMSLLTDNPNVIIDCEYNKDTTTVIQKLIDAITALGGTV